MFSRDGFPSRCLLTDDLPHHKYAVQYYFIRKSLSLANHSFITSVLFSYLKKDKSHWKKSTKNVQAGWPRRPVHISRLIVHLEICRRSWGNRVHLLLCSINSTFIPLRGTRGRRSIDQALPSLKLQVSGLQASRFMQYSWLTLSTNAGKIIPKHIIHSLLDISSDRAVASIKVIGHEYPWRRILSYLPCTYVCDWAGLD